MRAVAEAGFDAVLFDILAEGDQVRSLQALGVLWGMFELFRTIPTLLSSKLLTL